MPEFSYKKGERLSGTKAISSLFQAGRSIVSYPVRIIYHRVDEGEFPAAVVISVPKRLFRKAASRNLLKRRIREAYRLSKPQFYANLQKHHCRVILIIQYHHREVVDYKTIARGIGRGLETLSQQVIRESQKISE